MNAAGATSRCVTCGRGLGFEEWSRGLDQCPYCTGVRRRREPAATFVRSDAAPRPRAAAAAAPRPPRPAPSPRPDDYQQMLDDVPEELLDELVAMLEAEVDRRPELAARMASKSEPSNPVQEVIEEIGIGRTPGELQWAIWGFATGFGLNVILAKYAQMSAHAPMSQFIAPMLIGGLVAGAACAAIGWGLARLRTR
ncbi:MAG: hypothetical protein ACM3S1_08510 [Hyphomicrobiales bacterium]